MVEENKYSRYVILDGRYQHYYKCFNSGWVIVIDIAGCLYPARLFASF